jgi:uncharacterized protein YkwD
MLNPRRVFAVAALATATAGAGAVPAHASLAETMVAKMNAKRASHGLPALRMSAHMNRGAYKWARFLMRHNWLGHASLRRAHAKGEIIEMHGGRAAKAAGAVRGWMGSAEHRAILLSPRFHVVGVGRASGRFGGKRTTIWVARFN